MKLTYYLFFLFFLTATVSYSQQKADSLKNIQSHKENKLQFTPIPYINYSQSQKFMYGLIGMATFKTNKKDTISPKSVTGASYIRTTRGSWFANGFAQLFFNEDKWRVVAMAGVGNFSFQTYLEDTALPTGFYDYNSESTILTARIFRNLYKRNYLGVGYFYNQVDTQFEDINQKSTLSSNALSLIFSNDGRDGVYFPTKGQRAMLMYSVYPEWLGNNKNFGILNAYFNKYIGTSKGHVWAFRAMAKAGTSDLDFQRQVVVSRVDLRGYTTGKYRGDGKFDLQTEYRHQLKGKLGLVGFAGLGTIYGSDIDDFNWKLYPSIGAGFRVEAVKSTKMRFGMDVAHGKDDWAFYFRIGESF